MFVRVCVSVVPTTAPETPCADVSASCVERFPATVDAAPYASYVFAVTEIAPVVSLYERPVPSAFPIASCAISSVYAEGICEVSATVPVASGRVIVRSAVGSVT